MKRSLIFAFAIALLGACSTQEEDFKTPLQNDVTYYASFEQPTEEGTRVYANDDLLLRWTADDRVSIFNKNTYNQQYAFTGETGDNAGGFRKVESDEFMTGNDISDVVSVYPYQITTKITESEVITVNLPAEQTYAKNTFGIGANTMVSVTSDNFLQYKNVGGYLMLKLYGEGVSVSSITLRGNNGEKLSGKASVTMQLNGTPSVVMADNATTEITLNCASPVQLGSTEMESAQFWFVVPPVTFSKGFTVFITTSDGSVVEKSTTKEFAITRNIVSKMAPFPVEVVPALIVSASCSFSEITISRCTVDVQLAFHEDVSSGIVGLLYSDSGDPRSFESSAVNTTFSGTNETNFYFALKTLSMNTVYYCVPFVIISGEYFYGQMTTFRTDNITYPTQGDFIDLGLSVLWSSANLGASSPTHAGNRYAWGELQTKETYNLDNYSFYIGGSYVDIGNSIVNTDYDVCRKTFGKGYRLPTASEISYLFTICSYAWAEYDGVTGVVVQGLNGNSIFIPYLNTNTYSGYHTIEGSPSGETLHFYGQFAGFMSGELSTKTGTYGRVKCLMISPELPSAPANYKYNQVWYQGYLAREVGQSVRAVYDASSSVSALRIR